MTYNPIFKSILALGLTTASLTLLASNAFASAYQVHDFFNSATATGDAGAGGAAYANDASTTFTNPAGLARIHHPQAVVVGTLIIANPSYTGFNTWSSTNPLIPPPARSFTEYGTANGRYVAEIPAVHFASCLAPGWNWGVSVTAPFGLGTNYDQDSVLRYNSTKVELKVADLTPGLSYQINNQLSLGAGFDYYRAYLTSRTMAGAPSVAASMGLPPTALDTLSSNEGQGWGYGGHVGILYQIQPCTRLGATYHSRASMNVTGSSKLSGALVNQTVGVNAISTDQFKTTLVLPPFIEASLYHEFDPQWAGEASVTYTQWNRVNNGFQTFHNVLAPFPVEVTLPWHYHNSWLVALGAAFKANCQWTFRGGVHYDQSPIKNTERFAFLPDNDRIGVGAGAHYQLTKQVGIDAGWLHLFVKHAYITAPTVVGTQTSTPNGHFRTHGDLINAQVTVDFC